MPGSRGPARRRIAYGVPAHREHQRVGAAGPYDPILTRSVTCPNAVAAAAARSVFPSAMAVLSTSLKIEGPVALTVLKVSGSLAGKEVNPTAPDGLFERQAVLGDQCRTIERVQPQRLALPISSPGWTRRQAAAPAVRPVLYVRCPMPRRQRGHQGTRPGAGDSARPHRSKRVWACAAGQERAYQSDVRWRLARRGARRRAF